MQVYDTDKVFSVNVTEEELEIVQSNDLYTMMFTIFITALATNNKEKIKDLISYTHGTKLNKVLINVKRRNKRVDKNTQ